MIKVYYKTSSNPNPIDITQSVIFPLRVPFVKRNKDYSLVLRECILRLTYNYNFRSMDTFVYITYNNQTIFHGVVSDYSYNHSKRCHEAKVSDSLVLLKNVDSLLLFYQVGAMSPTTREVYTAGGYTYVQLLYLLKLLFYEVGLSIDTQTFCANANFHGDVSYKHLKVDKNMFFCLNQSVTTHPHRIVVQRERNDKNYNADVLDGFELLSMLCSLLGLSVEPYGNFGYYIHPLKKMVVDRNYNVSEYQDEIYNYDVEYFTDTSQNNKGYRVVYKLGDKNDLQYQNDIDFMHERTKYINHNVEFLPKSVTYISNGEGKLEINLPEHFLMTYEVGDYNPPSHPNDFIGPYYTARCLIRPKFIPHQVQKIKTKPDFTKPCVLENTLVFDKESLYCEITQETLFYV